jgi:hypothetical protein
MFFAIPRFRSNSPNRRFPATASRTTNNDHASPTAAKDRAIGQVSFSNRLRLMSPTPSKKKPQMVAR